MEFNCIHCEWSCVVENIEHPILEEEEKFIVCPFCAMEIDVDVIDFDDEEE